MINKNGMGNSNEWNGEARRAVLKYSLKKYVPHQELERCLDEVQLTLDGQYEKRILPNDDRKHLDDYGLSTRSLNALKRAGIYTIADLKIFMMQNECFQLTGLLGVRNFGRTALEELLEKIPEIKAFCEDIKRDF